VKKITKRTQIERERAYGLQSGWKWRGVGQTYFPSEMTTTHLWFTLRMIWNHHAPQKCRFKEYKKYSRICLSKAYLKEAVRHLYYELLTRGDMPLHHQMELEWIKGFFAEHYASQAPRRLGQNKNKSKSKREGSVSVVRS